MEGHKSQTKQRPGKLESRKRNLAQTHTHTHTHTHHTHEKATSPPTTLEKNVKSCPNLIQFLKLLVKIERSKDKSICSVIQKEVGLSRDIPNSYVFY